KACFIVSLSGNRLVVDDRNALRHRRRASCRRRIYIPSTAGKGVTAARATLMQQQLEDLSKNLLGAGRR
ncbi:hypothetical protein JVV71_23910, partial [Vibrio cholerae O1]|nr:hypothetical protein [Vibrio cholerae O1]